ncbi:metallophosphoesterase [Luteococcus peritonei]|uniref:Metallophosphoesterase n=1 Tax=Luteococcus peritonei TaxID=88874 RepID=A0ABW4RV76_9ACTN
MIVAEHPRPDHLLVHISDTHFVPPGESLYGVADAAGHLRSFMERLAGTDLRPEALVFTGDLADRGEAAAYRSLQQVVEPYAREMGAQVVWVMGNHDDRATMKSVLLGREPDLAPHDEVVWIGGLRIVVLDSTVPGSAHGALRTHQLDWLAGELAQRAPEGTIVAMHHPPVPCVQDLAVTVELRDQPKLAEVLHHAPPGEVRGIIAGHFHYSCHATFAGVPVSVAAATCYTQDLFMPERGTRGRDAAQAVNLVSVYENTVLHSVMPIDEGKTCGRPVSGEETTRVLAQEGFVIPERRVGPSYAAAVTGRADGRPSARLRQRLAERGMLVTAHRGTPIGSAAQNTPRAALGALASGADMVELDVSVSTDGVSYAFHDGLEQAAFGRAENLEELDSRAIAELRHRTSHPERPAPVPRLTEVLREVDAAGGLVNLDRSWRHWPQVLDECALLGMDEAILVKFPASQPERLEQLRGSSARMPVMVICTSPDELEWTCRQAQEFLSGRSQVDVCAVELIADSAESPMASAESIAKAHELGLMVFVNCEVLEEGPPLFAGWDDEMAHADPDQPWRRLSELGVDIVQTDWPWLADAWRARQLHP